MFGVHPNEIEEDLLMGVIKTAKIDQFADIKMVILIK